ncbi:hypothetical protein ACFY04_13115 [Streptomyces sp. NPDC001549]|uniref:hypothetical protein n=1 Tax=Streptomyces sp. NPDC001549 TaxID=3364586 RepID=UPI003699B66F
MTTVAMAGIPLRERNAVMRFIGIGCPECRSNGSIDLPERNAEESPVRLFRLFRPFQLFQSFQSFQRYRRFRLLPSMLMPGWSRRLSSGSRLIRR